MSEALTESFCERCGTRYEFAAPTELNTFRRTRGLISGLRNYIMSQDALSDAVGDAMRSEQETLAARQLEAFHESFNFCIQCRQYACTNCWNDPAGRCRTCVPIAGTDDLIERFEASFHSQHAGAVAEQPGLTELGADDVSRRLGIESWPTVDLSPEAGSNGHATTELPDSLRLETSEVSEVPEAPSEDLQPATEASAAPEAVPAVGEEPGPAAALPPEPTPEMPTHAFEPWAETAPPSPEPEPVFAEAEEPMLPALEGDVALRWEQDASFELEPGPVVYEAELELLPEPEPGPVVYEAELELLPEPEPVAYEAEPKPLPEPEPEPVAYEAEPEPRPIVPINETVLRIPSPRPAPERQDERIAAQADDPALAARRAKLDMLGLGDPGEGPVSSPRDNVMPYRSSGASVHPAELTARGDGQGAAQVAGSFWDASAREVAGVMTHVGVQSCGSCGLSLSASARFCRRCGTRQARSA